MRYSPLFFFGNSFQLRLAYSSLTEANLEFFHTQFNPIYRGSSDAQPDLGFQIL